MNEADQILDDILARWHHWMSGAPINGVDRLDDPAFREARSRSGWDSSDDIYDREVEQQKMKAVDFQVGGDSRAQGGMDEPHRSAIYILARNACTGAKVWNSPRLPADPLELGIVIQEARNILTRRLMAAGVL
ncbi:hypothetical protein [Variovorax sp. UMC13]|uniref:hypothetical protein n=1 Tax=Variovorax sp. UMC13 TaxID=1862326 RepID=UPI001604052F|nr:hypothetical protein [Variovorax sp. UMC13]MBB1599497.1 hypothetical protein [Variovorax sp. UMC13]